MKLQKNIDEIFPGLNKKYQRLPPVFCFSCFKKLSLKIPGNQYWRTGICSKCNAKSYIAPKITK